MKRIPEKWSGAGVVVATLLAVLVFAHILFARYFPGPNGMGHDYSYFLPHLLDNAYWTGMGLPWAPPWFTPAFCGGLPSFPDPQSMFYSLPQVLVTFTGPVQSVYTTFLAFLGVGFIGTYAFVRHSAGASRPAALAAAALFALNGFFSHRMLVGHLAFHAFMLVPLLAWALTHPGSDRRTPIVDGALWGIAGGAVLAYWVVGGMVAIAIPAALAVCVLVLVYALRGGALAPVCGRALIAAIVGLGLSASKIAGTLAYTQTVSRDTYLLPGMNDAWTTIKLALTSLFISPVDVSETAASGLRNVQWELGRHEFEFGLTLVPALLIGIALVVGGIRRIHGGTSGATFRWRPIALGTGLFATLVLPIAVNTYEPGWNAFLKALPVIGSSSNLFRWFLVYIPFVAVLSAFAIDAISSSRRMRAGVAALACVAAMVLQGRIDRDYYMQQSYDPVQVTAAFARAREPGFAPAISGIGAYLDNRGQLTMPLNRNDAITFGTSQLACYNPLFGYRLEFFPVGNLRLGDALRSQGGYLNIKDPACYIFPEENACEPGDHFAEARQMDAELFLSYRPFPFKRSLLQRAADVVNMTAIIVIPLLVIGGFAQRRRASGQRRG